MYRVSSFSHFLDTCTPVTLLDSAASVHVFSKRNRFSNFRRLLSGQGLRCGNDEIIPIEGWGQVSLPLKVRGRIRLLTLHNVAYISNFPLNLVSLGCLQKRGFDWSPRSGEISKNSQTIGYTRFRGNNYEIGDDETESAKAFATLTANSATSNQPSSDLLNSTKSPQPYQEPHSAATPDIWHRRMGHIGPLGMHMLGKNCLGIRLRGKKMSQCTHCAVSKISQQISRRSPANQSMRPFHRVYIDWLDLEDSWDSYQGNGTVVRRAMVAICEATGMAVTYFTQSAKESENLPLTQNLVNWLAKRYNLEVKVIRSDNEMNRIKTTEWCNKNGISFESCAPDTHAQNGGAERFGRLIMEKARAMRLSANLPHILWRDIVFTATYLYNRTPRASNNWKSPYEAFHSYVFDKEEVSGPRKPLLHYLRAYGCKAYTLIKSKGDPQYRRKRRKLDAKAHIGFLVGYESTNIYRIWIPHKKKVISVRDVIFDEDEVWDGKPIQYTAVDIKELDEAIQIIEEPQSDELEDVQLGEDIEIESPITRQTDYEAENLDVDNIDTEAETANKLAENEEEE